MRISDWSSDVCSSDLDERIDLALDLVIDALACVKGHAAAVAGLHFAGDATGVIGGIEPLDRPRARFRGQNVAPDGLDIAAQRRHATQPGHEHPPHQSLSNPISPSNRTPSLPASRPSPGREID